MQSKKLLLTPDINVRDIVIITGGFLFGVGLMIADEILAAATSTSEPWNAKYDWSFPPVHWQGIWVSWEIDFVWILLSVALILVGMSMKTSRSSITSLRD